MTLLFYLKAFFPDYRESLYRLYNDGDESFLEIEMNVYEGMCKRAIDAAFKLSMYTVFSSWGRKPSDREDTRHSR